MRLALLLRSRRRLLMQFDPALTRSLIPTSTSATQDRADSHPGIKRTYSQQAVQPLPRAAIPTAPPAKKARPTSPSSSKPKFSKAPLSAARQHKPTMPPFKNRQRAPEAGPSSSSQSRQNPPRNQAKGKARSVPKDLLEGPLHDDKYIEQEHSKSPIPLTPVQKNTPKNPLNNFYAAVKNSVPEYVSVAGTVMDGGRPVRIWRTTIHLDIEPPITGIGDHKDKKQSTHLAALSAVYQLQELGILDAKKLALPKIPVTDTTLSDGSVLNYVQARSFMDYYCRTFSFESPDIEFLSTRSGWEAVMTVGGRRIGLGAGVNKKAALTTCYLDVTKYLESCDPELWKTYVDAAKTGKDLGMGPRVSFYMSNQLGDTIGDICYDIRKTSLYRNRPSRVAIAGPEPDLITNIRIRRLNPTVMEARSRQLWDRRQAYLADEKMAKMRATRKALPVYGQAKEVLSHIDENDVTILMAATGSGKTTQIPQMILDEYIDRQDGSECNIICTQPRRLAAISVADRISKERGETLGQSIGYQVRFDARLPERGGGSVTFCTTGIFLKRLQSVLGGQDDAASGSFDDVTHVIVDEVHERDIDTDLLLVVLKQIMAQKRAKKQAFKVILMSATIDPTLFQEYFKDQSGAPAKVISIPGRSFPVTKYFMDDYLPKLLAGPMKWVANQDNVAQYIHRELGPAMAMQIGVHAPRSESRADDLELPYPLIAATIAHVLETSDDGHVLVFLPGWEEIVATQKAMNSPLGPLPINFNSSKYTVHLLHSSIPLPEQQAIFEPPPAGTRRIILSTNIAETSITIPDVVYVIDTAKIKEQRYDPDRHMSSLISAWVGSSNLNQRAGRAGRHRSGEYFGILSKGHAEALHPHQTVEMKRVDLSNVVMHVKALNFPRMSVEDVLAAAIEAPDPARVAAAMKDLQMVGALDAAKNLTSLGRVLLQLPVDAQMGRLVLYGSFFRCLDPALTLAAILTNRDPFMTPMHLKEQARKVKNSWTTEGFRSDPLATLKAFDVWWAMQSRGEYISANRFCVDNFLSKPTLLTIQKIKVHLLQALYRAGAIDVSAGGTLADANPVNSAAKGLIVPPALNANRDSLPLLTALIAIASQPKFGVRTSERSFRTSTDKVTTIHPSSVNHKKQSDSSFESGPPNEKQLYAFAEKRRNDSMGTGAQTFLVGTTRLDPLTYVLFGAYHVDVVERGLECDDWLPIVGDVRVLDEVQRLKRSMESCMLRVFEGITHSRQRAGSLPVLAREDVEEEFDADDADGKRDYSLSSEEIQDLDLMTRDIVSLLNRYSDERIATQSRQNSRAPTPFGSPSPFAARLPGGGSVSGYSTPSANMFQSRPGTPSRFRRM